MLRQYLEGGPQERQAQQRFLLYIDILGFSDLVAQKGNVDEVYEIINRFHVHRHDVFNTIIFSDTILVYNKMQPRGLEEVRYIVMFLCEFAQDLFCRLVGRDIHFRAYITCGGFAHYPMENIEDVFYGEALIEAYRAEKEIQATGLFMSNLITPYSDIFKTTPLNRSCQFVYIMQTLQRHSARKHDYPLDPVNLVETDDVWMLAYDIRYLKSIYKHMSDMALSPRVRKKYETTWRLLMRQHGGFMSRLEESGFNPKAISVCDWTEAMERIGTPDGCFG